MTRNLREEFSGKLVHSFAEQFSLWVINNPEQFPELYSLSYDTDPKVAWRAAWICEKISYQFPEWFINKRSELAKRIIHCSNDGSKRSLLNILLHLPVEEPISVEFLNFCLDHMLSPQEPIAIQAQCIKMAYKLCQKEPELLPEFKYILENAELEFYSKGIQSTVRNTLEQLNSTKNKYV
jgi:hypothetical protein